MNNRTRKRKMSNSNSDLNESPNHFLVLDAITRSVGNLEKIAKVTKLSKEEVESFKNHKGMVDNINEQLLYLNKNIETSKNVELKHENSVLDKKTNSFIN
jgi:hypothetical protein